jgi:hypothetical protein
MTTSNVSTAVKIVVSMVVVAALVATHFSSSKVRQLRKDVDVVTRTDCWDLRQQRQVSLKPSCCVCLWLAHHGDLTLPFLMICPFQPSTGLKGARKLQGFGGIVLASSQGQSDSNSAITTGVFDGVPSADDTNDPIIALPGGTGKSFGNGNAVGTSNGFVQSGLGQALASGTSGGNSTASTDLTVLSMNPDPGTVITGGGLSGGILSSVGNGGGSAGGNAVFGPSLTLAIAAATPASAPPAPEVEVDDSSKNGSKNGNAAAADMPAAPTAPAFSFDAAGLPTGGGGGGFASGSGITTGFVASPDNVNADPLNSQFFADEAYGNALANGFGFGVGSGVAVNAGMEQAGGSGGGTALGQGQFVFELDDVQNANFANSGLTNSSGGAGAYVGFNPPTAQIFNAFITPPPAAGP